MKLVLKEFQEDAVDALAKVAARAKSDACEGEPQTLTLAAPTGSGKTVIATTLMERIVEGDETQSPDPDASFLWITDQPELNEQTRRKILTSSTTFGESDLITVDAGFDQETFTPRTVYFLNTQKLGKEKQLVLTGDQRQFSIWDTINNTAEVRPGSFWVVIDEAHRGMSEDRSAREDARTIIQKFIKGSAGEIGAVPLVFGISATPDRFTALLAATTRTNRPSITVDPEDVRLSGLLKEAITLYHPQEEQPADLTLLRDASGLLKRYEMEWSDYASAEGAPLVRPILVVQVEDATKKQATKTDVASAISTIEDVFGPLSSSEIAHSFQEGHGLVFGDRQVRYLAPADIQDDPDLRVVLFKRSLTTGWDCPRAEVMMSFRRAVDKTLIAQLVGRMVRTPLARSVSASEFLNTVSLYLPHYDSESLDEVIEYLTDPDPEISFPTRVQRGENLRTYKRNARVKEAFAAAEALPTTRVERISQQSDTRRLLRLGRHLAWDNLDNNAPKRFTKALVKAITDERLKAASTKVFKKRVEEAAVIEVRSVTVGYGETALTDEETARLTAVDQNVDHAFKECGRKLGGGLHLAYLEDQASSKDSLPISQIKLELYALLQDGKVIERIEDVALELIRKEEPKHRTAIKALADERQQQYRQIRRQASRPEAEDWELPQSIDAPVNGAKPRTKHLYSESDGKFACEQLNTWEEAVLEEALAEEGVVAWLRNQPRKPWSFTVAYRKGKEDKPMFPDFMVFRRDGNGMLCDIYEPHSLSWADSVEKAKGLAEFARIHGDKFGRIQLIAELKRGVLKRLRLDEIDVRDEVLEAMTDSQLRKLFEKAD